MTLPDNTDMQSGGRGRRSLVARITPEAGLKEGDRLRLQLDPARLQLFDADSGRNLGFGDTRPEGD
jgi:hypothetical protein